MSQRIANRRAAQARARRQAMQVMADPPPTADTVRIDTLTHTARASWFALLSYLAFVGVTLLAVSDADFFNPDQQTALPLVGVSIPTRLFFTLAPVLGAALFAYHQFHLLKLWEVLAHPPTPARIGGKHLSDLITPWLVSDFALGNRLDGALRPRPLRKAAHVVALCLVFLATPVILFFFWVRSMPAHDEVLTVFWCGLPMLASIFVSFKSWTRLRRLTWRSRRPMRWNLRVWAPIWLAVSYVGWCATEQTLDGYLTGLGMSDARLNNSGFLNWASLNVSPLPLVRANLAGVDLVGIPPDWTAREPAEVAFRRNWCVSEGIPMPACVLPERTLFGQQDNFEAEHEFVTAQRRKWCRDVLFGALGSIADCAAYFERAEASQTEAWQIYRAAQIRALARRSLAGRDLRRADLSGMRLEGVDLSAARMQDSLLEETSLEGARLQETRLERADLTGARLEGAQMQNANLTRADLSFARLTDAELSFAALDHGRLSNTILRGAVMQVTSLADATITLSDFEGANLAMARLTGARIDGAFLNATTELDGADLSFAGLTNLDLRTVRISQDQIDSAYGDATVRLPPYVKRPAHWPAEEIPWGQFEIRWRDWQAEQGYQPTPPAQTH